MPAHDPRIDEYISKSADFAKPVLNHLRKIVHTACPGAEETIKWGMPHFEFAGGILCSMAAFKQHCAFVFRLASLMSDPEKLLTVGEKDAMGHFGQIKSVADLPSEEILIKYIKEAMALNEKEPKYQGKRRLPQQKKLKFLLTFSMLLDRIKLLFQLLKNSVHPIKRNTWNG